jgi:hypothetical protein
MHNTTSFNANLSSTYGSLPGRYSETPQTVKPYIYVPLGCLWNTITYIADSSLSTLCYELPMHLWLPAGMKQRYFSNRLNVCNLNSQQRRDDRNVTENARPCQYFVYFHNVLIIDDLTSTFSARHRSHCLQH